MHQVWVFEEGQSVRDRTTDEYWADDDWDDLIGQSGQFDYYTKDYEIQ